MTARLRAGIIGLAVAGSFTACTNRPDKSHLTISTNEASLNGGEDMKVFAKTRLEPMKGASAQGSAVLKNAPTAINITVTMRGVAPGTYDLKVHRQDSCSEALGPTHGDVGHLVVPASGAVTFEGVLDAGPEMGLANNEDVVGMVLVLHKDRKANIRNQEEAEGPAISCGIIEAAT